MDQFRTLFLGVLLLVSQAGILPASAQQTADERPNIILLVTDDHRWDALGANGNPIIQTPNLDRMAEAGVSFENMFVVTSICATSRATIMTGQYPSRHGIHGFGTGLTRRQLQQSYMGRLKDVGYRVGFVGKWGVGNPPEDFFDYDRAFPGQGRFFVTENGEERHLTSIMGDQALEFIEQASSDGPFLLSVSFKAPHVQDSNDVSATVYPFDPTLAELYADIRIPMPVTAAPQYFEQLPEFLKNSLNRMRWGVRFWGPGRAQESWKGYYRLISGVDREVGRIRDRLRALGVADDTIIIFTSENGMFMGEHGFTGKWYPHEPSIRIPLIVYDPRLDDAHGGERLEHMALTTDIAPTILELAGVQRQASMQGSSLAPLMRREDVDWRDEFFYEHLFEHPLIPATEAVRTERWKYIRYVDQEPVYEQLFDLKSDPHEVHNLMLEEGYETVKQSMRSKWEAWHEKVRQ